MSRPHRYGPGRFAEYQGYTYEAVVNDRVPLITLIVNEGDPVPTGLDPVPGRPDGFYLVAPQDVTAWYSSSWTFRWKGELFSSGGIRDDGIINGYYQGSRGAHFADQYLTRTGATEYEGDFPLEDVTDLTESRFDHLASWKDKHRS